MQVTDRVVDAETERAASKARSVRGPARASIAGAFNPGLIPGVETAKKRRPRERAAA